jgi:hypothetical protein
MISLLLTAALLSTASTSPVSDQTSDAAQLLAFLDATKRNADGKAQAMLTSDAYIGNYIQTKTSSFEEFARYSRECRLREIILVPTRDNKPMPIGVEWLCKYPEQDRAASFWFEGGKIARIGWGERITIDLSPEGR